MAVRGKKVTVSEKFDVNIKWLTEELGVNRSFDVVRRDIRFAGRDASLFFVDAFVKDDILVHILRSLRKSEEVPGENFLDKVFKEYIPYVEVDRLDDLHQVVDQVLAGPIALVIDGEKEVIIIDARQYPARQPQEPDLERVVRGSRDGFVETLVFNTALIRRRIRDPKLRMEILQAGQRSKSDICVSYLEDVANPEIVEDVKQRIEAIKMDGLPMAEKSVEELITPGNFWNPLPRVRYTERADVAAVHLLEGHVLVMVDTSPSIMILPSTLFHHLQHAEEYRQNPLLGALLRWVRFAGIFLSTIVLPLWLLFSLNPDLLPAKYHFIGPAEEGKIGLMWQILIAELGLEVLRMAAIHTPTALATALGLIAAVLIGDIAVQVGLFVPEVILYAAVAAVGSYSTPSYELSLASILARVLLVIATGIFGVIGFAFALVFIIAFLALTRSFGVPYLWPLIPFNGKALLHIILRFPVPVQNLRPSMLKPRDPDRQPTPQPAAKPLPEIEKETKSRQDTKRTRKMRKPRPLGTRKERH